VFGELHPRSCQSVPIVIATPHNPLKANTPTVVI
jgi:hypothetical protein